MYHLTGVYALAAGIMEAPSHTKFQEYSSKYEIPYTRETGDGCGGPWDKGLGWVLPPPSNSLY